MRTRTKIWLITAALLVLVGGILFVGVMTSLNWDFTKLSTVKYETNTYESAEEFKDISFETDIADIVFVPSDGNVSRVVCYEHESSRHTVLFENDSLSLRMNDQRKWYEYIGIGFKAPKITVYLPREEYGRLCIKGGTGDVEIPSDFIFENIYISATTGDVSCLASSLGEIKIKLNTGDIFVDDVFCTVLDMTVTTGKMTASGIECIGDIQASVSTGKAVISNASCKSFVSLGDTGDLNLKNVIAKEEFYIERSTGDVKFDGCDAAKIFVKTDTGDVEGSLLSEKIFLAETDTGRIDVPKTLTGGKCEIVTDTGDIKLHIK